MKGTVRWYNDAKGYGFIGGEDGNDVFVHRTAIVLDISLSEGEQVEYQVEDSERGPRATDVKKLENT